MLLNIRALIFTVEIRNALADPNYKPGDFRIEQFDFNELDQQKAENVLPELKDLRKKANQVV